MKSLVTIGLASLGLAFAAAQPAQAAAVVICASPVCGSASPNTMFTVNDFEDGFDLNGSQVQIGLNNLTNTSVSQIGSFVDGAAQNTFSGRWFDRGTSTAESATVFFTDPSGAISDVLSFTYAPSSGGVRLSHRVCDHRHVIGCGPRRCGDHADLHGPGRRGLSLRQCLHQRQRPNRRRRPRALDLGDADARLRRPGLCGLAPEREGSASARLTRARPAGVTRTATSVDHSERACRHRAPIKTP